MKHFLWLISLIVLCLICMVGCQNNGAALGETTSSDKAEADTTTSDALSSETTEAGETTTVAETTTAAETTTDTTAAETTTADDTTAPEPVCDHSYETVTTPPTCTNQGRTVSTCSKCQDSKTEPIVALGHDNQTTITATPTCITDGSAVSVCSRCGDRETITSPSTGHSYESTTTPATMTADGEVRSICKGCGDTKVQVIPAMEKDTVIAGSLTEHVVTKENGFVYLDAASPFIALGGLTAPFLNSGEYYRFSAANRGSYPEDIQREGATAAGGTLRFRISGGSFRIKAIRRTDFELVNKFKTYSFDVYVGFGLDRTLLTTLSCNFNEDFESETITLPEGVTEVMICLPYNMGFTDLQVAFEENAYIAAPLTRVGGIIGFYGSSITQGYDASSPSLTHAMQLCLAMDADCVNFGLSGAARGEMAVIDDLCAMIKGMKLTAFILDYDWNINSATGLLNGSDTQYSHYTIYQMLRETVGAGVPIVMATRPYFGEGTGGISSGEITNCIRAIRTTYGKAINAGDSAVAFLSGKTDFFGDEGASCHADTVHPNNRGHRLMADAFRRSLEK
ncbi:MAG: hypothetical protein IJD10_04060, partial [Clostridia bacterium]|nr:hypothetical protein [Clostridia bacterium]